MKLFVIGNGFDVSHGLQCRYSNFRDYLNENRGDIIEVMERYYYIGDDSDLWSDFETCLEEDINYESLTEIIGENTPNFASDDFSDGNWYDAQIYIEQECDELLEKIRSGFEEWIGTLELSQIGIKYKLDKSARFITFNYTCVLEQIYRIPVSSILHVHNKVGEELIFGHGKESKDFNVRTALYGDDNAFSDYDEDGSIESSEVGHEKFAEKAVCAFYDKMRKQTEKIIPIHSNFFDNLSEVNEVIILGHSYNEIDFPYFQKIAESIDIDCKWTLFYFSDKDKQAAEKVMVRLNIEEHLQEFKHCSLLEIKNTQTKLF